MHPTLPRALAAALFLLAAGAAQAQYVWIGPDGTRQYSDRPPPAGTPPGKIVKAPGRALPPADVAVAPEGAATAPDVKAPPTLAEREAAYRERTKKAQEEEQKRAEESKRQRQAAERCAEARQSQAQLASGIRIARIGQDGEKTYMSDAERATRAGQVNQALRDCR